MSYLRRDLHKARTVPFFRSCLIFDTASFTCNVTISNSLRANVTNGQTFGGNRSKINSAHILMFGRP